MGIKTAGRTSENPLELGKLEIPAYRKHGGGRNCQKDILLDRKTAAFHRATSGTGTRSANLQSKETSAAFIDALDVIVSIQEISDTVIYCRLKNRGS